jgi:predicted transcriptional regulator of viral defense system
MKTLMVLKELPQLFRYADVQKFTGNANVFLTRAVEKGLVARIARGAYANSFLKGFPTVGEVACFLRTPSYISCEWALNHHRIILQGPTVCTTITLSTAVGQSRSISYQGVTIEFAHIADRLFTGFETMEGFNMALPEKALLDAIYLRKEVPFHDELELDLLNLKRLEEMSAAYPSTTRRLAAEVGHG